MFVIWSLFDTPLSLALDIAMVTGGKTVSVTVATLPVSWPSDALYWKESSPMKPEFGM